MRKVLNEFCQLVGDHARVVGLLMQVIDLILQRPLLLLQLDLVFAELLDLGVDKANGLGDRLGTEQPAREFLLLYPDGSDLPDDAGLQDVGPDIWSRDVLVI